MATSIKPKAKIPIRRQSVPEMLVEALRERILSGEIRGGDSLVQETIAEDYEVSRVPVREALRQLEAQGLVSIRTHKGAVAISAKRETVIELLDLRILLECDILSHALSRYKKSDLSAASEILDEIEETCHDSPKRGEMNWKFHKCLYIPSNRSETLSIVEKIHLRTGHLVRVPLGASGRIHAADEEHRELLRLCAESNSAAVDYLRGHIYSIIKSLT
ncbi:GntR family transcriptional regulator [Mesorhizobium sp.]|uniref:GntR family transcriptional regulator n=1 Tax=Mesorhizobium sp. TaxID=1871066 RepID=UPI000FE97FD4|nr:GntR family transcriptional regulator [Mesorhizobium sp.]RWJ01212.1 MAG: GntR family transcriptional regulator [Mesorhizobium sp.]TIP92190.1 MAG: GntR family transcriptional regulator [Mesorhizobium sp.]